MSSVHVVGVAGATNQIGRFLLPQLLAAGHRVVAVSRHPPDPKTTKNAGCPETTSGVDWLAADLRAGLPVGLADGRGNCPDTWIHAAHLGLLPPLVPSLARLGVGRIVAFGSTSRYGKLGSADPGERALVAGLVRAEEDLMRACDAEGVAWTLFRPTMIYGCGMDKNIAVIARFIDRFGFFPLAGEGSGLRQPVHADDLAWACVAVLDCAASHGRAYNLSGGQTLAYRQMVERVFLARGRKPRILRLPMAVIRGAMRAMARLPSYAYLNPEMARRMNLDLSFDHGPATRDFGYRPRGFEP
jgi:nucleoside-diphosphate-sugar epimerase